MEKPHQEGQMQGWRYEETNGSNDEAGKLHCVTIRRHQINGMNATINEMREEGENKLGKVNERFVVKKQEWTDWKAPAAEQSR